MAGWSKIVDGSALDCFKPSKKLQKSELWLDLEAVSGGSTEQEDKLRCLFEKTFFIYLGEICGASCFRPLPPMLGNGKSVDLFKLYLLVSEYGGHETVSNNGLWDSVGEESGLGSCVGSAVKLIYVKYLDAFEIWLQRIVKDTESRGGCKHTDSNLSVSLMDLERGLEAFLSEISDSKKQDKELFHVDLKNGDLTSTSVEKLGSNIATPSFVDLDVMVDNKESSIDVKNNVVFLSNEVDEDDYTRKRKRECYLQMLNWVTKVARDPCDPALGTLPERYKWKNYGNDEVWKQVLLAREAMFCKGNMDSNVEQSVWQKKQKMHPTMYDDHTGFERLRCSQRLLGVKDSQGTLTKSQLHLCLESSSGNSDVEDHLDSVDADSLIAIWGNTRRKKRVPVGPYFQAVIPQWTGEIHESDSKWLGNQLWPSDKREHSKFLIERDRIGKGRQESCGCQSPGSVECVRFHVTEKRTRLKLELGPTFYLWKFDKMGEEVAHSWTKEDERKFQDIVKSNPASMDKCFWDDMFRSFPQRRKQELVSYYFNVFLLRRRGYQNRNNPNDIDSDDDESEFASIAHESAQEAFKSSSSIFCSPKKVHLNFR